MTTIFLTSKQLQVSLDEMKKRHAENSEYRMQNYFNCVDDYSWGGICDKAQDSAENGLSMVLNLLKEQEENGGFLIRKSTELELRDLDGNFVSNNIINGKYGPCFMFGTEKEGFNFCGLAKKQSTFEKKGYNVISKNYNLKVVFTGRLTKSGYAERIVEFISMNESIDAVIDITINNRSYDLFKLRQNA
jgi:hypothetical protein